MNWLMWCTVLPVWLLARIAQSCFTGTCHILCIRVPCWWIFGPFPLWDCSYCVDRSVCVWFLHVSISFSGLFAWPQPPVLNGSGASSGAIFSPSRLRGKAFSLSPLSMMEAVGLLHIYLWWRGSLWRLGLFSSCGARTSVWRLLFAGHGLWGALTQ